VSLPYLSPEDRARVEIDRMLEAAGWTVQDASKVNLSASRGVAVREFIMKPGHGRADYLLFLDGQAVGAVEAKPEGKTLVGVEPQARDYVEGMPEQLQVPIEPLPLAYVSTGTETRFRNGLDPDPRSRDVFSFHRPETVADWVSDYYSSPLAPTLRHRLQRLPPADTTYLWPPKGT
jgi:type I restriction enzyme, R subunit